MTITPTIKSSTLLIIIICLEFNILIALCNTFNESDKNTISYYDDIDDIATKYEKRSKRRKEEMEDRREKLLKQTDRESTKALNNIAERLDNMTNLISTLFRKYSRREPPNYPDPVEVKIGNLHKRWVVIEIYLGIESSIWLQIRCTLSKTFISRLLALTLFSLEIYSFTLSHNNFLTDPKNSAWNHMFATLNCFNAYSEKL